MAAIRNSKRKKQGSKSNNQISRSGAGRSSVADRGANAGKESKAGGRKPDVDGGSVEHLGEVAHRRKHRHGEREKKKREKCQ